METRAAVTRKGAQYPVLEDVELGAPLAGEILVRIVACGICPTDLDAQAGHARTPRPIVLGHEGAGIVEAIGANVTTLTPGDHVVLTGSFCGTCRNCLKDLPSYCETTMRRNFGGLREDGSTYLTAAGGGRVFGHFFGQSSFAGYAIAEERSAVKVPADLPLVTLAPLGCGFATGAGAVFNAFAASADDTLAVFGVGAVGLTAVMAAKILGLKRIVAVDRIEARLQLALELGATDVIDATKSDVAKSLRTLSPAGFNFALNTTSSAEALTAAVECLALHGTAGYVATPREPWTLPAAMLDAGRTLKALLGSGAAPQKFLPRLIAHYQAGKFPIDRLVTSYPFTQIETAMADLGAGRAIKPVLAI